MSTIVMAACWPLQDMSPAQKSVLISLADQANDSGVCWPSYKTLSERTCLSERAVRDAIEWLERAGAIKRERRWNSSTVYTVTASTFDASLAPSKSKRSASRPADAATPADAAPVPANAAGLDRQMPPPNRNGTVNEPSIGRARTRATPPKPDDVDEQVWADWLALRKAKKAPVSQTTLDGAVRESAKAGLALDDFLREWCERGSQGLKAEWLTPHVAAGRASPETFRERDHRLAAERVAAFAPGIADRSALGLTKTIDMEACDAIALESH